MKSLAQAKKHLHITVFQKIKLCRFNIIDKDAHESLCEHIMAMYPNVDEDHERMQELDRIMEQIRIEAS